MAKLTGILLAVAALAAGCASKPQWEDEVEEYRYLSRLANPTPEQWKRKNEIAEHPVPTPYHPDDPPQTVEDTAWARDAFDRMK